MKRILAAMLIASALGSAFAQTKGAATAGLNEPGDYGRVTVGDVPKTALVEPHPVLVQADRAALKRPPIYLYVPAEHSTNWRRHCARYNACAQPAYFVRDDWLEQRYAREHPGWTRKPAASEPAAAVAEPKEKKGKR